MQQPEIAINLFSGETFADAEGNLTSDLWKERIQAQLVALDKYTRTWGIGVETMAALETKTE